MLVLQGGTSNSLSHEDSTTWQTRPHQALYSLPGIIAAAHDTFIPAVSLDTKFFDYASPRAGSLTNITAMNPSQEPLHLLTKPLHCSSVSDLSAMAFEDMRKVASEKNAPLHTALSKMAQCLDDFDDVWKNLLTKYSSLISATLAERVPGIDDKPIGVLDERGKEYELYGNQRIHNHDARTLMRQAAPKGMAEHFAVAEFLMKTGLSRCISINPPTFFNLHFETGKHQHQSLRFFHDQHPTGSIPTLYLNALYFRALGSCLLELVRVLKNTKQGDNSLFDSTLIQMGSEFNRSARVDASGSDHGHDAVSATFFSGRIRGPSVHGPMYSQPSKGNEFYAGSWGTGAPVKELGHRQFDHGDITASVAHLFGLKAPAPHSESLLEFSDGMIRSRIGKATLHERPV